MKRQKSPGVIYVGRLLYAAQGLVDDLTDRAGAAERGAHRVARNALSRRDHGATRMEELRREIAELSSHVDALVRRAPAGELAQLS